MNKQIVSPRTVAQQAAAQAAQLALTLRRAGFHAEAAAIWNAAKGVISQ